MRKLSELQKNTHLAEIEFTPAEHRFSVTLAGTPGVITFDLEPDTELLFNVTLVEDMLTLSAEEVEFDLGDGPELASLLIEFVRR